MRPLHDRLWETIAGERRRLASRRSLVTGAAKVAGSGIIGLALGGAPLKVNLRSTFAQEFGDDIEILNYALTLEHLENAFYRDGLAQLDEEAFTEDNRPASLRRDLELIAAHEAEHVEFLTQSISAAGGTPVEEAEYDFGDAFADVTAFLETAQALENTGVAAYNGAASFILDPAILASAASIASVEARHAAYLNARNGETPFPDAFDESLSRGEVLEAADPFFATGAAMGATTA